LGNPERLFRTYEVHVSTYILSYISVPNEGQLLIVRRNAGSRPNPENSERNNPHSILPMAELVEEMCMCRIAM
jgi:hypothetical protein